MTTTRNACAGFAGDDGRLVYDVPEAGAKLGLSRNSSYEAAARGDIPTIRIGRLLKVPKAAFDRMLDQPVGKTA
jgi:excisionase family DNA binding protein